MRGYGESDKPSGVDNYVMEKLDNDVKVRRLYELWNVILSCVLLGNAIRNLSYYL